MKNLIIDTDCGMDDIIAIAMIVSNGNFSINGITTVRGLVTPRTGKKNLLKILRFLKSKVGVVSGSNSPLNVSRLKNSFPKQDVINSTKLLFLKNLMREGKTQKQTYSAVDFLFRRINLIDGATTLLCLGPLTNIAKTILKYGSKFTKNIEQILIMGGAVFTSGNVSPKRFAEYNTFLDPEAAGIVFSSGIPIKLISIDSTRFVPATDIIKKLIQNSKPTTKYGKIIKRVIVANQNDFDYFYDPLAAAILVDPKLATETKRVGIKVVTRGQNVGQTIPTGGLKNVEIVTKVDSGRFLKLMTTSLK